jgi:hypothetical protein
MYKKTKQDKFTGKQWKSDVGRWPLIMAYTGEGKLLQATISLSLLVGI